MSVFDRSNGFDVGPFVQHHINDRDQGVSHAIEYGTNAIKERVAPSAGYLVTHPDGRAYYERFEDQCPEPSELPVLGETDNAKSREGESNE